MHAYELRICGLDDEIARTAARWELFACPEVRDLVKAAGEDHFLVLYEGKWTTPRSGAMCSQTPATRPSR